MPNTWKKYNRICWGFQHGRAVWGLQVRHVLRCKQVEHTCNHWIRLWQFLEDADGVVLLHLPPLHYTATTQLASTGSRNEHHSLTHLNAISKDYVIKFVGISQEKEKHAKKKKKVFFFWWLFSSIICKNSKERERKRQIMWDMNYSNYVERYLDILSFSALCLLDLIFSFFWLFFNHKSQIPMGGGSILTSSVMLGLVCFASYSLRKAGADLFNKNWLEAASQNVVLLPPTFQMGFPQADIILVLNKHTFTNWLWHGTWENLRSDHRWVTSWLFTFFLHYKSILLSQAAQSYIGLCRRFVPRNI